MMKPTLSLWAALIFSGGVSLKAQSAFPEVKFWVGTGSDSSVLVIDFKDGTWDSCYAWGYLHSGPATGEEILNAVAAADINFSVNIAGGFLMDIHYGSHSGVGGTNNFNWSTWSGTGLGNLTMNMGIGTQVAHGEWFACSFTDFNPPLAPGPSIPAFNPSQFTPQDVQFWVGSGPDSTLLVIDFLDGNTPSSYAWGFLHSGPVTAEQMLQAVDAADPQLSIAMAAGFLNDISYLNHYGIGGTGGLYWGTWSATNLGNWDLNMGLSTMLGNGDFFGCSFMNFNPVIRPGYPVPAAVPSAALSAAEGTQYRLYPNPAQDGVWIENPTTHPARLSIVDLSGRTCLERLLVNQGPEWISLQNLSTGTYFLSWQEGNHLKTQVLLKR